ncbi:MAG TPA: hypothetical protein VN608_08215 [Clostridia bacterium]|nr:hypothetical protein [Clostridia bacterium]
MTLKQLESSLDKAVLDFSDEIQSLYTEGSGKPATENDIVQLARHTFYTLSDFKTNIIDYLKGL